MFNTTKQMKLEGTGPQINVRFNPNRLREVRKEASRYNGEHWRWQRAAETAGTKSRQKATNQIMFMLQVAYQDNAVTTKKLDVIFTMIHQLLVERNIWDSDWDMHLPVVTLLD